MRRVLPILLCLLALLSLSACGQKAPAETAAAEEITESAAVADASQMVEPEEVVEAGMTPVYGESLVDGDWPVEVKSSSSMFRIESAVLHVRSGEMTADMTMGGKGYLFVYPGTAPEAAAAEESACIPFTEDENGAHIFTIPVEALDAPVPCAAFSKNKELWYERSLLFRVDSLPAEAFTEGFFVTAESLGLADGNYTAAVTLSGGSGRASVESPARLTVKDGLCTAEIVFSSKNYDYVRLDDTVYLPVNTEGNSAFQIPVACCDRPMAIVADTVAMSEPHEIAYTLLFDASSLEAKS